MKIQWLGVQGTLSAAISDVDVTISSAGLADLPEVVAPDYAKLVIDPAGSDGRPEVVYVTAHAAAATTATISRGEETEEGGSVARSHADGAIWYHAATPRDYDVAALPLLDSGTYTPTLTDVANVSSSTSYDARWIRIGNQIQVVGRCAIDPTSATTLTRWRVSLPVASDFASDNDAAGVAVGDLSDESAAHGFADTANDEIEFSAYPVDIAQHVYSFSFMYTVI